MKCNVLRLAVRYDIYIYIYMSLGVEGLRTGDHESQVCSRKYTSILFRTINVFDFIRRAYRNSTWKSVIQYNFLVAFTNLRKATCNIMFTSPSDRKEHFWSQCKDFDFYNILGTYVEKIQFSSKSDQQ
jgi:hypothetical protein